jgi:hypothetical protein
MRRRTQRPHSFTYTKCIAHYTIYSNIPLPLVIYEEYELTLEGGNAAVIVDADARGVDPSCVDVHKRGGGL